MVAVIAGIPYVIEREHACAAYLHDGVLIFAFCNAHRSGNFCIGCSSAELCLKVHDGIFYFTRLLADGTRHPVKFTKLVKYCASDSCNRICLEFDIFFRIKFIDGIKQTELTEANKIIEFNTVRHTGRHFASDIFYQRHILPDKFVAKRR